jgi:hypothetical protein
VLFAKADDGARDRLDCGDGIDTAYVRAGDMTEGCETVVVVVDGDDETLSRA